MFSTDATLLARPIDGQTDRQRAMLSRIMKLVLVKNICTLWDFWSFLLADANVLTEHVYPSFYSDEYKKKTQLKCELQRMTLNPNDVRRCERKFSSIFSKIVYNLCNGFKLDFNRRTFGCLQWVKGKFTIYVKINCMQHMCPCMSM